MPASRWLLAAALTALAAGCGGSGKFVPVEGVLTLDGKPVEGATITFLPEGHGRMASARSGTDGSFRVTTMTTGDGAAPGEYKVTVTKASEDTAIETVDPADPDYYKKVMKIAKKAAKAPSLPAIYADAVKTPLRCRVPTEGTFTLELKKTGG